MDDDEINEVLMTAVTAACFVADETEGGVWSPAAAAFFAAARELKHEMEGEAR